MLERKCCCGVFVLCMPEKGGVWAGSVGWCRLL